MEYKREKSIWYQQYLIGLNLDLHGALLTGSFKNNFIYGSEHADGLSKYDFYIVNFRIVLIKDNKGGHKPVLVYNYLPYNEIFADIFLVYLISRHRLSESITFKDKGNFYTIIDSNLGSKNKLITEIKKSPNENNEYLNYNSQISNDFEFLDDLDFSKKFVVITDINNMCFLIDLLYNKDSQNFIHSYLELVKSRENADINTHAKLNIDIDVNLLNSCLFIVKDLEALLKLIKDNVDKSVNQGPQSRRGCLTSMHKFNDSIDMDFRNRIYKHNSWFSENYNRKLFLPKNKFSFENVHWNLGNIRWYSTNSIHRNLSNVRWYSTENNDIRYRNRQQLFQNSYNIIADILNENSNVGNKDVQMKIEKMLFEQEKVYSSQNLSEIKLKFDEKSYDFLQKKRLELIKILTNWDKNKNNYKEVRSTEFYPVTKKLITFLTPKNISSMLIAHFLEMLSIETVNVEDDLQTPGIPTIRAFDSFGKKIINRYIFIKYINSIEKKNNKDYSLSQFKEEYKIEFQDIYSDENSYAKIGGNYVWLLVTIGLLYQELDNDVEDRKKTIHYLRIENSARDILMKQNQRVFHLPQKLPMVCEPNDYEYRDDFIPVKLGGYLLNDIQYTDGIFKEKIGYEKETLLKKGNLVVPLVNGLSKTPYKINIDTLDYVYRYGLEKKILIDEYEENFQEFLKNPYKKKSTKKDQKLYWSNLSKLILQRNILSIADTFSKVSKIYFPIRLCKRTRLYCETNYFDYQSSDLARGLILFVNPGKIVKTNSLAIKYLKAYGANMYGNGLDKKSLNYRVKWIDDNSDKLLDIENNNIVELAENKICFISFCFEYKRLIEFMNDKNKVVFYTYLPIQLDATCNGFQHLALLTREAKLLNKLNLDISTHDDDPDDFYTYITEKTYTYFEEEYKVLSNSNKLSESLINSLDTIKKLLKVKFDRNVIKLVIMTKPYKASMHRLIEQIVKKLEPHEENKGKYYTYKDINIKLTKKDITFFVKAIKNVINKESPKIMELTKYLNEIVAICTELNMPIPWRLPNGAEVLESYEIRKKDTYKAFSFIKAKYTFIKHEKGKYSLKKQKDATMANLIHSLDASTIALLYKDFNKDLYTVHDCFAVTADYVEYLISKLKSVYIQMYSDNTYLVNFDQYVKLSINNRYGDDVYKINEKFINLPSGKRSFPCINKILKYDSNTDVSILNKSSYPAI